MENIREAIERAKRRQGQNGISLDPPRQQTRYVLGDAPEYRERTQEVELDIGHLQSQRVVAYDGSDPQSRPFDMLRTEILQSMDLKGWKTLAVTSPTPNCGKTFTAVNLALSMARQPDRQVLLADLDLRKPNIANNLGLECREGGVVGVVERRVNLQDALVNARVGNSRLEILPTVQAPNAADMIGSAGVKMLLDGITGSQSRIVILDLPPLLTGHDVISTLPHVDCVLLVAAVGTTKVSEIKECNKYLEGTNVVRFVLNKVPGSTTPYVYY